MNDNRFFFLSILIILFLPVVIVVASLSLAFNNFSDRSDVEQTGFLEFREQDIYEINYPDSLKERAEKNSDNSSSSTGDSNTDSGAEAVIRVRNIAIGDALSRVIQEAGHPSRQDLSKYGFIWYIYNQDYHNYTQVGIKNNQVVGLYTNSAAWTSPEGVQAGSTRDMVRDVYGDPLSYIQKGNVRYEVYSDEYYTYQRDNYYLTVFFDLHDGSRVTAVQLIERETELAMDDFYPDPGVDIRESYERQIFDLSNAVRVREGLPPFRWCGGVRETARKHSEDMATRNFFDHDTPEGRKPADRLQEDSIYFVKAGENIASGQTSAIFAHEGWMNSSGHRSNILADFERLGVGVYFGGSYYVYYTQKFYTP